MKALSSPGWGTRLAASASASTLLWISRTLLSLLVAYPLLLATRESGMVNGPEGDAVLFRPGSLLLLEFLRVGLPELSAACKTALLLAGLALVSELLPLAAALDLMWLPGRSFSQRLARAFALFPRFLGLGGIALLAQAALLLAASLLSEALKPLLRSGDERVLSLMPIAVLALGLLACSAFGCVLDLARATLVQRELTAREALTHALSCLQKRPFSVLLGAYPSVAGAALGYLCAAWAMTHLDLSSPSQTVIAQAFAVHQLALLFALGFRVRWLRTALELSNAQPGSSLR